MSATILPLQSVAEIDAKPQPDDLKLWSVTTILKAFGDSNALIEWSARTVARNAITTNTWQHIAKDDGTDAAINYLADSRYRPPKDERSATKLGTAIHAAIEHLVVTGQRPPHGTPLADCGVMDDEIVPYLDSFDLYLNKFSPTYEAAEMTVYHPGYGYAGTLDGIATLQGQRVLIDYKTSKDSWDGKGNRKQPWTDVALQTAAYRHAELAAIWKARRYEQWSRRYYLLNQDERNLAVPMPHVDGTVCIHITPHHCDIYPIDTSTDTFAFFLYAIEGARWAFQESKTAIGEPIALIDRST